MKKILAGALLLASTPILAHDVNTDSCDVDLNAGVKITTNSIEFSKNGESLYQIVGRDGLIVDGEAIMLSSSQAALVQDYSNSIRAVVPEVKSIAIEGIALATEGVNLAFNELLGEGNEVGAELTHELANLSNEIDNRLSVENGIEIGEDGVVGEDFFGEEFEQRIEENIERAIKNSMGSLLIAVGQEMMFSGGDMEAFETRMEDFGQRIEHQMETRGLALEQKADAICESIVAIDQLETELQNEIDALSDINIIEVSHHGKNKA